MTITPGTVAWRALPNAPAECGSTALPTALPSSEGASRIPPVQLPCGIVTSWPALTGRVKTAMGVRLRSV